MTPKIRFFPIADDTINKRIKQAAGGQTEDFFIFTNLPQSDLDGNGSPIWCSVLKIDMQTSYIPIQREYIGAFTDVNSISGHLYRYRFYKDLQQAGAFSLNVLTQLFVMMPYGSCIYWVYGSASSLTTFQIFSGENVGARIKVDTNEPTLGNFLDFSVCPISQIIMYDCELASGTIDNILIQAAQSAANFGTVDGIADLGGNNSVRTSASDAAVSSLISANWAVTLN